jgi:hypothetical protein
VLRHLAQAGFRHGPAANDVLQEGEDVGRPGRTAERDDEHTVEGSGHVSQL